MQVLVRERQEGKTASLVNWLQQGERTDRYPGWSRVLVVIDERERARLREEYWSSIEDIDHRLWTYAEWTGLRPGHKRGVEVAVDNLDLLLAELGLPGVTVISMTGHLWSPRRRPRSYSVPCRYCGAQKNVPCTLAGHRLHYTHRSRQRAVAALQGRWARRESAEPQPESP